MRKDAKEFTLYYSVEHKDYHDKYNHLITNLDEYIAKVMKLNAFNKVTIVYNVDF